MSDALTVDLAKATAEQINTSFAALVAELEALNNTVAESGTTAEINSRKAELAELIDSHRAAYTAATADVDVDVTPLAATVVEDSDEDADEDEIVEPETVAEFAEVIELEAAEIADSEDDSDEDDEGDQLTDAEIAEAAARAHASTTTSEKPRQNRATRRAALRKASRNADDGTSFGQDFDTNLSLAEHIARKSKNTGPIVGFQMWDRDSAKQAGLLAEMGMGDTDVADLLNRATGRTCIGCGVNKAACGGCAETCNDVINDVPYTFCGFGNEINDWWVGKTFAMTDRCKIDVNLPRKRVRLQTGRWGYCVNMGVDEEGNPVFATGEITQNEKGEDIVANPWKPDDQETWKNSKPLDLQCARETFALEAIYCIIDVSRAQRLCNGAEVDRELGFASSDLGYETARTSLDKWIAYATEFDFAYTGDATGALNFADGFLGLVSRIEPHLSRNECVNFSDYDVFVVNANEYWLQQESCRSLVSGKSALDVLNDTFNNVIFTDVLPSGVDPADPDPYADGGTGEVTLPECDREVKLVLVHPDRWALGQGEDFQLVLDRADKATAKGNAEMHMLEIERIEVPTDGAAAMTMTFLMNNKGMLAGVAEPCAA